MKKILVTIVAVVAALVATLLVLAMLQPAQYTVERSVAVNAPADKVYTVMSDFNRFGEWSPWEQYDPTMKKSIEGAPGTVGHRYHWVGNDQVGEGDMKLTKVEPGQRVEMDLDFLRPFPSKAKVAWIVANDGKGSKASWVMTGENDSLVVRIFGLFRDGMLGKDFEAGLARLKVAAEKEAAVKVP